MFSRSHVTDAPRLRKDLPVYIDEVGALR